MRRSHWFALLAVLTVTVIAPPIAQAGSTGSGARGTSSDVRVIHTIHFRAPWRSYCDGDQCVVQILAQFEATVPADMSSPTAVVTASLNYRVTPGGAGRLGAQYGILGKKYRSIPPGDYPLAPTPSRTTTTATWTATDLTPGATYVFGFDVIPIRDKQGKVSVTGTLLSIVVTIAPGTTG